MKTVRLLAALLLALFSTLTSNAYPVFPVTDSPSDIRSDRATLHGHLQLNKKMARVAFEYRAVGARRWHRTTWERFTHGQTNVVVFTNRVTGLAPQTTYEYRVTAIIFGIKRIARPETPMVFTTAPQVNEPVIEGVTNVTVTATNALFAAFVTPNSAETTVYVDWGTTLSYGSSTVVAQLGPSPESQVVSYTVPSLTPGTRYHVRFRAVSDAGTAESEDQTFVTFGDLPIINSSRTTNATATSVDFRASVDGSDLPTTVYFQWGTTTAYSGQTASTTYPAGSAISAQVVLPGLAPATEYHARAVAVNAVGTVFGPDLQFTTLASAPALFSPTLPITVTTNSATINFSANPNGAQTTVLIDWGTTSAYGSQQPIDVLAPGNVTLPLTTTLANLENGTTYHFRITAQNSSGTTTSGDMTFTTLDSRAPILLALQDEATVFTRTFSAVVDPNGSDVSVWFEYSRNGAPLVAVGANTFSPGSLITNAATISVDPATPYSYRVVVSNAFGVVVSPANSFVTGAQPPQLTDLSIQSLTPTGAVLRAGVAPRGAQTTLELVWGFTTNYDHLESVLIVGAAAPQSTGTFNFVSLPPETTVYYQFRANSSAGSVVGTAGSFTTPAIPCPSSSATVVVTDLTETSLRAAIANADNILFGASGTITLTAPIDVRCTLSLSGNGNSVTISGNNATRLFRVRNGAQLTVTDLTLSNGWVIGANAISGPGASVDGGAVAVDAASFRAIRSSFLQNGCFGGNGGNGGSDASGGSARGGAVFGNNATLTFAACYFEGNTVVGGTEGTLDTAAPGTPGHASGGAIAGTNSSIFINNNCAFVGNVAQIASGLPNKPFGNGGAVFIDGPAGSANISECIFTNGYVAGSGAAIYLRKGTMTLSTCTLGGNVANSSGDALGGAVTIDGGAVTATESTFVNNFATGGSSPNASGSAGAGGGIAVLAGGNASVARCTFYKNQVAGGAGTGRINNGSLFYPSGVGIGGAIYSEATTAVENCTFYQNSAVSGFEPDETVVDTSAGMGGAIGVLAGNTKVSFTTIADNFAYCGSGHTNTAFGGGVYVGFATLSLTHTILSSNVINRTELNNASGIVDDQERNISSDATPQFTAFESVNNTDAGLGAFGNWGGPTFTIRLLLSSLAIDYGDNTVAPDVDQRNFRRPQGTAVDVGAYEFEP